MAILVVVSKVVVVNNGDDGTSGSGAIHGGEEVRCGSDGSEICEGS